MSFLPLLIIPTVIWVLIIMLMVVVVARGVTANARKLDLIMHHLGIEE